ncbi:MAG: beta-galactosidase, partial [Hymenobacter sp.]|nr:beta-galactosidase [Hymenobacter sp.]
GWRGGLAQGPGNYILAQSLPVEGGVNRVLVRTTTQAGTIRLQATAAGLESAEVRLKSSEMPHRNGLARQLPGADLPGSLQRGPTPAGPSFTASRFPVAVARVTAGSNAAEAHLTYDDNELSEWVSAGPLPAAWIQYELARPAAVSEVAMKVTDWRSTQYPIRILLDGKEVFAGTTERTLGYYTASFPAHTGQTLRIELTGAGRNQDAYNIVEITGQKDPAAGAGPPVRKATLGLVEVEVYEKATGPLVK